MRSLPPKGDSARNKIVCHRNMSRRSRHRDTAVTGHAAIREPGMLRFIGRDVGRALADIDLLQSQRCTDGDPSVKGGLLRRGGECRNGRRQDKRQDDQQSRHPLQP
jgi:hypothetical protein